MATSTAIIILAEALLCLFVVWGFLHEDRFIRFEKRIEDYIHRRIRIKKRNLCAEWLAKDGMVAMSLYESAEK